MSNTTLLPPNATPQERALEGAAARISDVPADVRSVWNPDTCPAGMLPWLAWAYNVDEWDASWPAEFQRQTIRDAFVLQRKKGTVGSIRRAITNAGYGDATILEGTAGRTYDGSFTANGTYTYGDPAGWANYRVFLTRPMTTAQADQVRRILSKTQPARCNLAQLSFVQANNQYNGAIRYNGAYNHGTA
jgi:phage tail P2-like protein